MKSDSNLEKVLAAGHFAVTGELGPPRGNDVEVVKEKAKHLVGIVDAVNITDNQTAMVRMSSWATAIIAKGMGLEPNYQMVVPRPQPPGHAVGHPGRHGAGHKHHALPFGRPSPASATIPRRWA